MDIRGRLEKTGLHLQEFADFLDIKRQTLTYKLEKKTLTPEEWRGIANLLIARSRMMQSLAIDVCLEEARAVNSKKGILGRTYQKGQQNE